MMIRWLLLGMVDDAFLEERVVFCQERGSFKRPAYQEHDQAGEQSENPEFKPSKVVI
jgi:hypothetical protein